MLGLLMLAGLATAAVIPELLPKDVEDDAPTNDPDVRSSDTEESNILDDLPPSDETFLPADDTGGNEDPDTAETLLEPGDDGLLHVGLEPGSHALADFDPLEDQLVLDVPDDAEDLQVFPANPETDSPATISWVQSDGLVELQFDGLDDVPVGAISMQFESLTYGIALADVLAAQEGGGLQPTDPTLPSDPDPTGDGADDSPDVLVPIDPETPALPGDPDPGDDTGVAEPVADPDPLVDDSAEDQAGGSPDETADIVEDETSFDDPIPQDPNRAPEIIRDFTPGDETIVLDADPDSDLAFQPLADGSGTQIFVNGQHVATVMGTISVGPDDIAFEIGDAPMVA